MLKIGYVYRTKSDDEALIIDTRLAPDFLSDWHGIPPAYFFRGVVSCPINSRFYIYWDKKGKFYNMPYEGVCCGKGVLDLNLKIKPRRLKKRKGSRFND